MNECSKDLNLLVISCWTGEQKGEEKERKREEKEGVSEEINELSQDEINDDENLDDAENETNQRNEKREQETEGDDIPDNLDFDDNDVGEEEMENEQTKGDCSFEIRTMFLLVIIWPKGSAKLFIFYSNILVECLIICNNSVKRFRNAA